jgi:hypothetical protein
MCRNLGAKAKPFHLPSSKIVLKLLPALKKWQIKAKPKWHHFGEKMNCVELLSPPSLAPKRKEELQRKARDSKNQDAS